MLIFVSFASRVVLPQEVLCLHLPGDKEEPEKNQIKPPLVFLSIGAVTGGLKVPCHRGRCVLQCVECSSRSVF